MTRTAIESEMPQFVIPARADGSVVGDLGVPPHDYVGLGYTGGNLTTVTYKTGGSGGTTVATLTLGYDGSGNLTSVAKI